MFLSRTRYAQSLLKIKTNYIYYFFLQSRIDASVFQKLNFVVEPGTHVAIVGGSGSGKSTVAQLLLRFFDPTHGAGGIIYLFFNCVLLVLIPSSSFFF